VVRAQAKARGASRGAGERERGAEQVRSRMLTSYEDLPRFTSQISTRQSGHPRQQRSVSLSDEATDTLRRVAVFIGGEAVDLRGGSGNGAGATVCPLAGGLAPVARGPHRVLGRLGHRARPPEFAGRIAAVCAIHTADGDRFAALMPWSCTVTPSRHDAGFRSFTEQRWPLVREICGVYMRQLTFALQSARNR